MEEILRFEHVSYAYEEEREALLDVCVKVCAGERVAVLGSNGAGKSTFFLLANGVLRPGAGRILFRGAPVGGGAKQLNVLRRGVGLVFQDPEVQLLGGSVEEEVSFGPMNLRLPVGEVRARVDAAIRSFALEEYRGRAPQYLSGGEKKRVTLADAPGYGAADAFAGRASGQPGPGKYPPAGTKSSNALGAGPGAYGCNARRGFRMALGHPGAGVPRGTAGGGRGTAGDF